MSRPKCPGLELPKVESILTSSDLPPGSGIPDFLSMLFSVLTPPIPVHPSMHPQQKASYSEQPFTAMPSSSHLALLSEFLQCLLRTSFANDLQHPQTQIIHRVLCYQKEFGSRGSLSQSTDSVRTRSKREGGLRRVFHQKQNALHEKSHQSISRFPDSGGWIVII